MATQPQALQRILSVARSQLGIKEGRGNKTKYGRWYGMDGNPWCAMFVSWCAHQANIPRNIIPKHAYTPSGANHFKRKNQWHRKPKVGDIVYFDLSGLGRISHVGIVEKVHRTGGFTSIEGNTDVAGGRTGGQVMRKRRFRVGRRGGFGRPDYSQVSPPKPGERVLRVGDVGGDVKALQILLRVGADGKFGPKTEQALREYQLRNKLHVDGIAGEKTWASFLEVKSEVKPSAKPTPKPKVKPKPKSKAKAKSKPLSECTIDDLFNYPIRTASKEDGSLSPHAGENITLRSFLAWWEHSVQLGVSNNNKDKEDKRK